MFGNEDECLWNGLQKHNLYTECYESENHRKVIVLEEAHLRTQIIYMNA
jgi:hypothetical protein